MKIEKAVKSRWDNESWKNAGFGSVFSDHMFIVNYKDGQWQDPEIKPYGPLNVLPSLHSLHYGQAIFEGMKAYKGPNDEAFLFRPEQNAKRLNKSAVRMCMPEIPETLFLDGLHELISIDKHWIPNDGTSSLYIRPFMYGSSNFIKASPSNEYTFIIITCPVETYYSGELHVKVELDYTRASSGGTGAAKAAGNYGASFYPAKKAQQEGFQQLIWTDGNNHQFIEESGTMNIFFKRNNELITPPLSDSILPGITRESIIKLANHYDIECKEEKIDIEQMISEYKSGKITEAFGVGTAASVANISSISYKNEKLVFNSKNNALSEKLKKKLQDIQFGRSEDPFNWCKRVN